MGEILIYKRLMLQIVFTRVKFILLYILINFMIFNNNDTFMKSSSYTILL